MPGSENKDQDAADSTTSQRFLFGSICASFTLALLGVVSYWQYLVNKSVPEQYLDEVFHIRQAQVYCKGDFQTWDPKITTPPGLYLISYVLGQLGIPCSVPYLRFTNALILTLGIFPAAFVYRSSWSTSLATQSWHRWDDLRLQRLIADVHTALNTALFPPLFFFSALYYTDVASTALVVAALVLYRLRESYPHDSAEETVKTVHITVIVGLLLQGEWSLVAVAAASAFVSSWPFRPLGSDSKDTIAPTRNDSNMKKYIWIAGIAALFFRQTNIFWVAIFPAGLSLFENTRGRATVSASLDALFRESALSRTFYNPSIFDASVQDLMSATISMIACAIGTMTFVLSHPFSVQAKLIGARLAPYVSLVIIFGVFVFLNGGVVLGDKSNHIATIHLPQMLYIWPYMMFFSAPLILPRLAGMILPLNYLPAFLRKFGSRSPTLSLMTAGLLVVGTGVGLVVIHFNTIVHPFTLADNRHYVFYVFRILRLNAWMFYAAAPVYVLCGWAVVQTLGVQGPSREAATAREGANSREEKSALSSQNSQGPTVNFIFVWLATTALCLIGAPLVEPRYFILPWIIWRLEVPSPSSATAEDLSAPTETTASDEATSTSREQATGGATRRKPVPPARNEIASKQDCKLGLADLIFSDYRLWLETLWHLAINAVTCYVFLYRGFSWLQEPGKVQRFLW